MNKYLQLLAKKYPTVDSVASEMINLSAIRSLPKGTEYFLSDLHGEYEAFLHILKSASGVIRQKMDLVFSKSLTSSEIDALANLIYYPEDEIKRLSEKNLVNDEWLRLTIHKLILVCEAVSSKYTRSKVRKRVPKDFQYIFDELLNVTDDINKDFYYEEIIRTIIDTKIAKRFVICLCRVIQSLSIDKLHIIGDIFDRGPRADIIVDELMKVYDVDIQWGNHDISWIGAASGNTALVANVIRIAMRYNNFDVLEDGYGLNLRALAVFASQIYKDDECTLFNPSILDENVFDSVDSRLVAKMHKAITVIQLKLEGQLIARHAEWQMADRNIFANVNFNDFTVKIGDKTYKLNDTNFPTVDKSNPLTLSPDEEELINILTNSFLHSEKLQEHIRFILSHGSMYKACNNNLMFHGCMPLDDNGNFVKMNIDNTEYGGKALFDKITSLVNDAYFNGTENNVDFLWYLWCGAKSPLFGKDKTAFFERSFLSDKELYQEHYNPYYRLCESEEVCKNILHEFGMDVNHGRIINGHVPVKIKDGESPVKAGGKLFVIDGGIAKAYWETTGIAGYTLIFSSHEIALAEHKPFIKGKSEHTPTVRTVEKMKKRVNVADTDNGKILLGEIEDLKALLLAYRGGKIK